LRHAPDARAVAQADVFDDVVIHRMNLGTVDEPFPSSGTGGSTSTGGGTSTGGSGSTASGGKGGSVSGFGGSSSTTKPGGQHTTVIGEDDGSCGCRQAGRTPTTAVWRAFALIPLPLSRRRR
jgi:hypothetical protein